MGLPLSPWPAGYRFLSQCEQSHLVPPSDIPWVRKSENGGRERLLWREPGLAQPSRLTVLVLAAHLDVIGPPEPILAMVGEAAELPCHLSPTASAAHMELRWFREKLSPAVLVHRDGRTQDAEQMAGYRGRVTLIQDDIAQGRVALRILGVQASDDGEYRCLFRLNDSYGEASVRLTVAGETQG